MNNHFIQIYEQNFKKKNEQLLKTEIWTFYLHIYEQAFWTDIWTFNLNRYTNNQFEEKYEQLLLT